jgi:hypothetical protein
MKDPTCAPRSNYRMWPPHSARNYITWMCMIIRYIFRNNSISLEKVLNKYAYFVSFRCKYKKSRANLHCCTSYKLQCKETTQVNYVGLLLRSKITNSVLIMCIKLHEYGGPVFQPRNLIVENVSRNDLCIAF